MLGAIVGDIVGSRFEGQEYVDHDFALWAAGCHPTDDSYMSLAVARALMEVDRGPYGEAREQELRVRVVSAMQEIGRRHLGCGFGARFLEWIESEVPSPYASWGNGAAMRVSACGWVGRTLDEVRTLSRTVTAVSHTHAEALCGAEAVAVAVFLARNGMSREELREHLGQYYDLGFKLSEVMPARAASMHCKDTVPLSLTAFFEGEDFVDCVRRAVGLGGDTDTLGAITGSIAEAYFGIGQELRSRALSYLEESERRIVLDFEECFGTKVAG